MSSYSQVHEIFEGSSHTAIDHYAKWCTENFRKLLCRDPKEAEVQEFLERNPWLVPGHSTPRSTSGHFPLHCSLITQPELRGQRVRFPDFMWIATHSGAWFPTLIEIEKPNKKIYKRDGSPTAHFTKARNQLNQWRTWFNDDANVALFKRMYGIPEVMHRRTMQLHMILIYGRRSEFDEHPELVGERGTLLSGDEELMSFDRLLDPRHIDTSMKHAVTVKRMGDGRYRAKYVPPIFDLGPTLAERLLVIDGFEDAIEKNPDISNERKRLLQKAIPYWKNQASPAAMGITGLADRE